MENKTWLAGCTLAIVAALGVCTWSINWHIDRIDPGLTENSERLHDMNVNLAHIEDKAGEIAKNTASIDYRLMPVAEQLRTDMQRLR